MFSRKIKFSCHEDYFDQKEDYPIPAVVNIPEWYKKLEHSIEERTIKGCMPFLDTLKIGYILKMPQDMLIKHNVPNPEKENKLDSFQKSSLHDQSDFVVAKSLNFNTGIPEAHPPHQLEGAPLIKKNSNQAFHKILNPWIITTPAGYSCLFVPPLNNADDRFSILPGIVDTDEFNNPINFPIVLNGDKYPTQELFLKKGTPYVQVIPFKRDNWKMELVSTPEKQIKKNRLFYDLTLFNKYKNKFWKRKTCK